MRVKVSEPLAMRVAKWASEHAKKNSLGFERLIFGTSPDGTFVRIADTRGTIRLSALWVDLLPSQAMCGYVVTHAADHLMDHANHAPPGTQKQVPLESGELWKYAICNAVSQRNNNRQQQGVIKHHTIRVTVSSAPGAIRECSFRIDQLDALGFAYAENRLERSGMLYTEVPQFMRGMHAPPLPVQAPLTMAELRAADAAFEGV